MLFLDFSLKMFVLKEFMHDPIHCTISAAVIAGNEYYIGKWSNIIYRVSQKKNLESNILSHIAKKLQARKFSQNYLSENIWNCIWYDILMLSFSFKNWELMDKKCQNFSPKISPKIIFVYTSLAAESCFSNINITFLLYYLEFANFVFKWCGFTTNLKKKFGICCRWKGRHPP